MAQTDKKTGSDGSPCMSDWVNDPLWYKDAIIYELHVKAFFDSSNDGIGDFKGLTEKLDYLQDLGVNTLWLLPFYPSPFRDDGYDISDYRNVHPQYGTRADVKNFVREAHRRGLKVITELVINHTSDQHPWFQAARRAPAGSRKRDFYIWSDSDDKYPETRIIFTDTEKSNWAWDEVAQAYYWHRFFSHQPDLNHNNPEVVKAVIRIMRFWLDIGVDGLRLDAIPYLCVREGTANENLPETHNVIKQMRAVIDTHYKNRMLLAEANQWPEDVREYFGDGDECHMAYNFPVMPRIFMAVAQEDRHPIVEIVRQTPDIPDSCQWAIFLRNHDELTLEMVTSRERDYMYSMYAIDPRMRVNVGIRRRLAPLMDNNRDKIELVNFLLMTLPGSPVLYYGDEIGMGDNIYLGDRNGVRTPMQWSPDRNAGFSKADPQRLFLPPIMDPIYGYESNNVEAQSRNPSSLLNWTKRLIAVRKNYCAFGRGTLKFLEPGNRKILAFVREWENEKILCVVNLSRTAQPVELDLSEFKTRVPVELLGRTSFPPIGELPYLLTLKGYGYYGFRLATDVEVPYWHEERLARRELPVLVMTEGWLTFSGGRAGAGSVKRAMATRTQSQLQREVLAPYLTSKRWFAAKGRDIQRIDILEQGEWNSPDGSWLMALLDVHCEGIEPQTYFLPLAIAWEDDTAEDKLQALAPWTLAKVRQKARVGILYGAFGDDRFCRALVHGMQSGLTLPLGHGKAQFRARAPSPTSPQQWQNRCATRHWSRATPRCTSATGSSSKATAACNWASTRRSRSAVSSPKSPPIRTSCRSPAPSSTTGRAARSWHWPCCNRMSRTRATAGITPSTTLNGTWPNTSPNRPSTTTAHPTPSSSARWRSSDVAPANCTRLLPARQATRLSIPNPSTKTSWRAGSTTSARRRSPPSIGSRTAAQPCRNRYMPPATAC